MACVYIKIKERTKREKKSIPQRKEDEKHHRTARRFGESYSKQALETMIGSFLRKVKKKMRSGEVLNQSTKQLETSGKPNSPTNWSINPTNRNVPRGHDL